MIRRSSSFLFFGFLPPKQKKKKLGPPELGLITHSDNPLLHEAFIYARNHSQFYDLLNSDETIQMYFKNEVIKNQQCVKNTRSSIKQQLQKKFSQDWFKAQNDISDSSRQKYTNKEINKGYRLEEYLKIVRNPAHGISMTKLRLGVHT